jgi:hypothetical protein
LLGLGIPDDATLSNPRSVVFADVLGLALVNLAARSRKKRVKHARACQRDSLVQRSKARQVGFPARQTGAQQVESVQDNITGVNVGLSPPTQIP